MSNVVVLPGASPDAAQPALHDASAVLRTIADDLEAEAAAYGPGFIARVVVVVRASGREPTVHAAGDCPPAQAFMDLHAGAQQLMSMRSPAR